MPPLGQVLLVTAVASQEIGIAEVHLDVGALRRQQGPNVFRIGDVDFAELGGDFGSSGVEVGDELLVQVHARGAYRQRILGGDSRDHGKGVVFGGHRRRRQVQENSVGVDQAYGVALANEGYRGALNDGDAQLVGQQPHHGCMLHPGQLFQGRAALTQGNEEDIAAQVGSEDGEELGSRHLAVAHDLDGGRSGDAEAGIVTEEVTYGDREQNQPGEREDHDRGGERCGPPGW